MKLTLQDGLDALANAVRDRYPTATGVDVRQVWDKLQSGAEPLPGMEADAARMIVDNRDFLIALVAKEQVAVEATIGSALDNALATNLSDIATGQQWLTTNTGTLTAAALSNAMRFTVRVLIALLRQQNGTIRLLRRKLDTAEGAALKTGAPPTG